MSLEVNVFLCTTPPFKFDLPLFLHRLIWFIYVFREVDFEEKQLGLIQKLDFSNEVEKYGKRSRNGSSDEIEIAKENKKKKKNPDSTPWPWQSLMENMQAAQQELSLIIDVINTVLF